MKLVTAALKSVRMVTEPASPQSEPVAELLLPQPLAAAVADLAAVLFLLLLLAAAAAAAADLAAVLFLPLLFAAAAAVLVEVEHPNVVDKS